MNTPRRAVQRVFGIGLAWAALWDLATALLLAITAVLDPESLDPGEPMGAFLIFGAMGFLSGGAFAVLLLIAGHYETLELPLVRAVLWGVVGTAIVQTGFLGHGDAGLAANAQMALLFCAFGGAVAAAWLLTARRWAAGRLAS